MGHLSSCRLVRCCEATAPNPCDLSRYSYGGYHWPVWGHLIDSIKTGESARALITGNKDFEHLERDPALAALFNQNMSEQTRILSKEIVRVYDFSQMKRIVDVGGGYGGLITAILTSNPGIHGVLFDLPHATEGARLQLAAAGLGERCEVVGGNFFRVHSKPGRRLPFWTGHP